MKGLLRNQWDRSSAVVATAVGALLLVLGWIGVSAEVDAAFQIPYVISGGVGGLFALGIGAVLWISADLRDEWRKLDELHEAVALGAGGAEPDVDARRGPAAAGAADPTVSSTPWGRPLLALMVTATTIGAAGIGVAWFQTSGSVTVRDQIPWLNVAVLGMVLAGVANAAGVAVARRRIAAARRAVVDSIQSAMSRRTLTPGSSEQVAATAMGWYHRPSCLLMRSKQSVANGPQAVARRRPCPVCEPAEAPAA